MTATWGKALTPWKKYGQHVKQKLAPSGQIFPSSHMDVKLDNESKH